MTINNPVQLGLIQRALIQYRNQGLKTSRSVLVDNMLATGNVDEEISKVNELLEAIDVNLSRERAKS